TSRQYIARIIEVHDLFQALEIAVVTVGFHELRIRAFIHVAERRHLEPAIGLGRKRYPPRIRDGRFAERMALDQKAADSAGNERSSRWIGGIVQRVRLVFQIIRQLRISRHADIAGGKIREQRILSWPAVTMARVAIGLATKQGIAGLLVRRE